MKLIKLLILLGFVSWIGSCYPDRLPDPDAIECFYSDWCPINHICNFPYCDKTIEPRGPLIKGSQTVPCVEWNETEAGKPLFPIRKNPWCLSGLEEAVRCEYIKEPKYPLWTYLCK